VNYLVEKKIGFLVATDDVQYRIMLLEMFEREDEAKYFSKHQYQPCSSVYLDFAFDRLACLEKQVPNLQRLKTFEFGVNSFALLRRAVVYRVTTPH